MNQMNLNEAFWEHTAMKKIFCGSRAKNKLFGIENQHFGFIGVHLVHLRRQLAVLVGFLMNQMNLNVVLCCLWREIYLVVYSGAAAMNFDSRRFIGVH